MGASNAGAGWRTPASLAATTTLVAAFAALPIAWPLAAVLLVPWLSALDRATSWRGVAIQGAAMTVLFTVAVFWWFAIGIGQFTGVGTGFATAALVTGALFLQPQVLVFALVRHAVGQRHGPLLRALAGAAAWVGVETLWPKLLGDTLGHGLHPADALRQAADAIGATGLTVVMLLTNEAVAQTLVRRSGGWKARALPLLMAIAIPSTVAAYGALRLDALRTPPAPETAVLRIAMVQASLTDYEARRREQGAYAVVREVLDTHFGLSASALRDHGADVLLWSETVYPTTFGQPRSEDGAAFDAEIQAFVDAMGVPLVFGAYERDPLGEYNAAVFLEPGRGRLGSYRKTHPFPLTEHVPGWLDGPWLREALPWAGGWQAGDGARVMPLRSGDGREVNVLPLICLDDVHPQLAIDGARLGAQAIVGMSNDSWFTHAPLGARLHLAVAAFRSVETGLPQLRVTTNGLSAVIDETGEVLVHTAMGQQAVLTGDLLARDPAPTLMVRWGDWVGHAGVLFLAAMALWRGIAALARRALRPLATAAVFPVVLMPTSVRLAVVVLRGVALASLVALAHDMATRIGWQVVAVSQLRGFGLGVLLPLLAAGALRYWARGTLRVESALLVIDRPRERIEIPHAAVDDLRPWPIPLPGPGLDLRLRSGRHWSMALASPSLACAAWRGGSTRGRLASFAEQRERARRPCWDHALLKFGLFPLLPALIAFRLHQVIAFGGTFGEWLTFGPGAWFTGLAIWWASWSLGLMLFAAALRVGLEAVAIAASWLGSTERQVMVREGGEWLLRGLYYIGAPVALAARLLAG